MDGVKKIIVTAIGIISGILTIIQFIWAVMDIKTNKISIIIDLNYFIKGINGVLFSIPFAIFVLCIGILYRMNKSNKKIQEELMLYYSEILSIIQEWFSEERWKDANIKSEPIIVTKGILFQCIHVLKNMFKDVFNKSVNVKIQIIREADGLDPTLSTICNTDEREAFGERDEQYVIKVKDNTAYYSLVVNGGRFFEYSSKNDKNASTYFTSDPNWRRMYSSLIVVPMIRSKKAGKEVVQGFISISSIDKDAFNPDIKRLSIPIVETLAGYLLIIIISSMNSF